MVTKQPAVSNFTLHGSSDCIPPDGPASQTLIQKIPLPACMLKTGIFGFLEVSTPEYGDFPKLKYGAVSYCPPSL